MFKLSNLLLASVFAISVNAQDNAGLKLPVGFSATLFADQIGTARHIAITDKGVLFAKLNNANKAGQSIVRMEDTNGDGVAEKISGWGKYGGTGIYVKGNQLYASSDDAVYLYQLDANGEVTNPTAPKTIIQNLHSRRQHASKSITLDPQGNIYVNIGAYSNACQEKDRAVGSKGMMPCPILDSAGGIWKFDGNQENQSYAQGKRYATGLRNVIGLDWSNTTNSLFVTQHGRDQLNTFYPAMYTDAQNADLPAETMYEMKQGDNAGWPYVYYDPFQNKKMLAPEYGGDGKTEGSAAYKNPAMAFPAHMAPNALLFYTGTMFPEKYKNGAFIAFHGSWNRSPLPQEGYYVAFVPFENGKPTGKWEIFANGFAGVDVITSTRAAQHRPCGLAQGPDGSLYVSDDSKGTIYRILYNGK